MTQPLALLCSERLLPGTQLADRLMALHFRVQQIEDVEALPEAARKASPMVVLMDLDATKGNPLAAIQFIKAAENTSHVPIIAFSADEKTNSQGLVGEAGATVVAQDQTLLNHLSQILDQALRLE